MQTQKKQQLCWVTPKRPNLQKGIHKPLCVGSTQHSKFTFHSITLRESPSTSWTNIGTSTTTISKSSNKPTAKYWRNMSLGNLPWNWNSSIFSLSTLLLCAIKRRIFSLVLSIKCPRNWSKLNKSQSNQQITSLWEATPSEGAKNAKF